MPAALLLAAVRRLVGADTSMFADTAADRGQLAASADRTLGLALQASLRAQMQDWVHRPDSGKLRRNLAATSALLGEVDRREAGWGVVGDHMLQAANSDGAADSIALARARALTGKVANCARRWQQTPAKQAPAAAFDLAMILQDAASELLVLSGRADPKDPQQTDWLGLVLEPHTVQLHRYDHACALIGAACWHLSGRGLVTRWQQLAWRLWGMSPAAVRGELQPPGLAGRLGRNGRRARARLAVLERARVVRRDRWGAPMLRPRQQAAATCLAILQARQYDAEAATRSWGTSLADSQEGA